MKKNANKKRQYSPLFVNARQEDWRADSLVEIIMRTVCDTALSTISFEPVNYTVRNEAGQSQQVPRWNWRVVSAQLLGELAKKWDTRNFMDYGVQIQCRESSFYWSSAMLIKWPCIIDVKKKRVISPLQGNPDNVLKKLWRVEDTLAILSMFKNYRLLTSERKELFIELLLKKVDIRLFSNVVYALCDLYRSKRISADISRRLIKLYAGKLQTPYDFAVKITDVVKNQKLPLSVSEEELQQIFAAKRAEWNFSKEDNYG